MFVHQPVMAPAFDRFGVVRSEDVEAFARAYFAAGDGAGVQAELYALLDAARDRFGT